jgi:cbb3-type cytochrome oxidase subunit 3
MPYRCNCSVSVKEKNVRVMATLVFWVLLLGLIAFDYSHAERNRFNEPPAIALGHEKVEGAGHCSGGLIQ